MDESLIRRWQQRQDRLTVLLEEHESLVIGETGKGVVHGFQRRNVTFEHLKRFATPVEHPRHHLDHQVCRQRHDLLQVGVGHLGFDHPELRQVPTGFGLLSAKSGTEAVDLAKSHGPRFDVELTALRQVGPVAKIVGLKQGGGAFTGIGRENRRIE